MREAKIEEAVCNYAEKEYGAQVRKLKYVGRKGAPDRMLFFPSGRVMFIEFKQDGKQPRPDQERELTKMRKSAVCAYFVDDIEKGKALVDRYAAYK